jgi:hypothetical protein
MSAPVTPITPPHDRHCGHTGYLQRRLYADTFFGIMGIAIYEQSTREVIWCYASPSHPPRSACSRRIPLGCFRRSYNHSPALAVTGVSTTVTTAKASTGHTRRPRAAGQRAHRISDSAVNGTRTTRKWTSRTWAGRPLIGGHNCFPTFRAATVSPLIPGNRQLTCPGCRKIRRQRYRSMP